MNLYKWINKNCTRLTGKRVVVTGATGGLGKELCFLLAELDANLVLACRNTTLAEKLKTEMRIYWAGVALVTFQWYSGISFKEILSMVPFSEILGMSYGYATDTTFDDFIEDMNRRYTERKENLTIHHI